MADGVLHLRRTEENRVVTADEVTCFGTEGSPSEGGARCGHNEAVRSF